ncbi:hypothetical protein WMF30_10400 [Sorangium sp. So ce134]
MYRAARNLLAARGVRPSVMAIAGAWDEVEHRRKVDALIDGLCQGGKK